MMARKLTKARRQVTKLEGEVDRWTETAATRSTEADELEATVGDRVLDAPDPDGEASKLTAEVARLRGEARSATSTAEAANRRLDAARREVLRTAAAEVRDDAASRRQRLDKHRAKVEGLLAQLEDLDGARYVPKRLPVTAGLLSQSDSEGVRQPIGERMAHEVARRDELADELEELADSGEINPTQADKLLAEADPDGPEAKARAERQAQAERDREARKTAGARLRAWLQAVHEAFDTCLVDAGVVRDMSAAHNRRVRAVPKSDRTEERYTDELAALLEDAGVDDARQRAEKAIAEAVKAARKAVPA